LPGVHIVTDSTADLPREVVEEYNITVVPLKVLFGREVFLDGVNLTAGEFFEKLAAVKELPITSQPAPAEFVEYYRPLVDQGASIISIHISSQMSGTAQSAKLAKNMLEYEDLEIIDSQTVSVPLGMMVAAAARAARAGKTKDEILELIRYIMENQRTYFMVDTLEYLQRGGRIGKAQAFLGTLLNVKPLLQIKEGLVHPYEKVRGRKKALNRLVQVVEKEFGARKVWVYLTHGNDPEALEKLHTKIEEKLNCREIWTSQLGPVVGTHIGPAVVGFAVCKVDGII